MAIKRGDWIVITTKSNPDVKNLDGSPGKMASLDGMILKLPGNDYSWFEMIPENGRFHWSSSQGHFRLAKPEEIENCVSNELSHTPKLNQEPQYEIY